MNSGSDAIENYLRVLRVHMDALNQSVEEALVAVPAEYREAVRARFEEEVAQPIRPAGVLSGTGGPKNGSSTGIPRRATTGFDFARTS